MGKKGVKGGKRGVHGEYKGVTRGLKRREKRGYKDGKGKVKRG